MTIADLENRAAALANRVQQSQKEGVKPDTGALLGHVHDLRQAIDVLGAEVVLRSLPDLKRSLVAANGSSPAAVVMALIMILIYSTPSEQDLAIYLSLLALDQLSTELYMRTAAAYRLDNPDPDYWFQRVDTEGSHTFNSQGDYLVEEIPPTGSGSNLPYYNCEIYNNGWSNLQPVNRVLNLYPVDPVSLSPNFEQDTMLNLPHFAADGLVFSGRIKVDSLKGGSRGWGFWNTSVIPFGMQVAWFAQYDSEASHQSALTPNGFYAETINGLEMKRIALPALDEGWHDYRIVLSRDKVDYFIDGVDVASVSDPAVVPGSVMAFHCWVDNAVFDFSGGNLGHVTQATTVARRNILQSLHISGGAAQPRPRALPFYSRQKILPQAQSPSQLSGWLSRQQQAYDMSSWCFYGQLLTDDPEAAPIALASVMQPMQLQLPGALARLLPGMRLSVYEAAMALNCGEFDGYRIAGTEGGFPSQAIQIEHSPWSATVVWQGVGGRQSTFAFALNSGEMGQTGARYTLTLDGLDDMDQLLRAEILLEDTMGAIGMGYGPQSFLPQWLTTAQQAAVGAQGGSLAHYLQTSDDAMSGQGSYYYSLPLLQVLSFDILTGDGKCLRGHDGTVWLDVVMQSFTNAAWKTLEGVSWHFIALPMPERKLALVVSRVTLSGAVAPLTVARLFSQEGTRNQNGSLTPVHEWAMPDIEITTQGGTGLNVRLKGSEAMEICLSPKLENQSITGKTEGLFLADITWNGDVFKETAWLEIGKND